jgi:asparagine synthase (glutamine-hydrolysing)
MDRFMAFTWDPGDVCARQVAINLCSRINRINSWTQIVSQVGAAVFSASTFEAEGGSVRLLTRGAGVVFGRVFSKSAIERGQDQRSSLVFSEGDTRAILKEGPGRLVEFYWGWYVAFVVSSGGHSGWVFRGPMSDLPCFHAVVDRVHMIFSQVEDCVALRALRMTVDWPLVQLQVGFGQSATVGQSAIREISVVERGEALWFSPGKAERRTHWDPCAIARLPPLDDEVVASQSLAATVRGCVHAWAGEHRSVLHRLSGGLDSSVVLRCLESAPNKPRITCINYYWEGGHVDERAYARAVAHHTNSRLLELRFGTEGRLDILRSVRRTAAPVLDVVDWQEHARERQIASDAEATAVFMGSLGDVVFERDAYMSPASDYLSQYGLSLGFFRVALDVALRQRTSIWKVFLFSCKEAWMTQPRGTWNMYDVMLKCGMFNEGNILVSDDVTASLKSNASARSHVWLRNVDGVPAGKLWLIGGLFAEGFYDRHYTQPGDPPIVAPFFSQPLVELSLRIPTYMNVRDGIDRATVRKAFAGQLPPSILRRGSKGGPETWLDVMLERDADFVREFLMDGILVSKGVVDRERLESVLPGTISTRASHAGSIFNLLYTEAWLRAWSDAPSSTGT